AKSANQYRAEVSLENPLRVELPDMKTDKGATVRKALGLPESATSAEMTAAARAKGYDGVVLDYSPVGYKHQEILAFDASSTKILTKNIVPAQPVLDVFDNVIRRASRTDASGKTVPRLGMEQRVKQAQDLKAYIEGYGDKLTFESAADLKRDFQELADQGKQYMADDPTKAKAWVARKAGAAVRKELLKVNPDLAKVWAEYGFWKGVRDVLQATVDRKASQDSWGQKMKATIWGSGTGAGAFMHGGSVEGAVTAAATYTVARALQSPTWKLISAQLKNSLADAIASGNPSRVQFFLDRIKAMSASPQLMRIPAGASMPVASHGAAGKDAGTPEAR
ncbi:MAG TPA: hypothetical protein VMY37_18950, partial [Thermoguttaceae bacterium]|nr:hypothetical protein [Thermoguttaceae bacterium]